MHKHADVIIAYAHGKQIECRQGDGRSWSKTSSPAFLPYYEYRVKPNEPTYSYINVLSNGANGLSTGNYPGSQERSCLEESIRVAGIYKKYFIGRVKVTRVDGAIAKMEMM